MPFRQVFDNFISNAVIHGNQQKKTSGLFDLWFILHNINYLTKYSGGEEDDL